MAEEVFILPPPKDNTQASDELLMKVTNYELANKNYIFNLDYLDMYDALIGGVTDLKATNVLYLRDENTYFQFEDMTPFYEIDENLLSALRECGLDLEKTTTYAIYFNDSNEDKALLFSDDIRSYIYIETPYTYGQYVFSMKHESPHQQVILEGDTLYSLEEFAYLMGMFYGNNGKNPISNLDWMTTTINPNVLTDDEKVLAAFYNEFMERLGDLIMFETSTPKYGLSDGLYLNHDGFYFLSSMKLTTDYDINEESLVLHKVESDGFQFNISEYATALEEDLGHYTLSMTTLGNEIVLFGKVLSFVHDTEPIEIGKNPKQFDKIKILYEDGTTTVESVRDRYHYIVTVPDDKKPIRYEMLSFDDSVLGSGNLNDRIVESSSTHVLSSELLADRFFNFYKTAYSEAQYEIFKLDLASDFMLQANSKTYRITDNMKKFMLARLLTGYSPMITDDEINRLPEVESEFTSDMVLTIGDKTIEICEKNYSSEPHYRSFYARIGDEYYYYSYDGTHPLSISEIILKTFKMN